MMRIKERYENDPNFRTLVDLIYVEIDRCHYTPSEVRDAAMLAGIRWEMLNIVPRWKRDEEAE